MEDRFIN